MGQTINFLCVFTVGILPEIGDCQKLFVSVDSNILGRLPVFLIFISVFLIERTQNQARQIIGAIGAGRMMLVDAANFHRAFGFVEIAFPVFIARFASSAGIFNQWTACFTVCPAASDFRNRHRQRTSSCQPLFFMVSNVSTIISFPFTAVKSAPPHPPASRLQNPLWFSPAAGCRW